MRPHYANIWGNPSNSERNSAQIRRNVWHFDMILALPTINSTQVIPKHWILDKFFSSCFSSAKISTDMKKKMNESTVIQDFWRGCSGKMWNYILQQPWRQFVFERLLYVQAHAVAFTYCEWNGRFRWIIWMLSQIFSLDIDDFELHSESGTKHQMAKVVKVKSIGNALYGAPDYFCQKFYPQNFVSPIFLRRSRTPTNNKSPVLELMQRSHVMTAGFPRAHTTKYKILFLFGWNLWKLA